MSDAAIIMRYDANKKSPMVAYLLGWFFGTFGGHRFYLGHTGSAVAMLTITLLSFPLMLVLVGFITIFITVVWAIVDAFLIPGMTREFNNVLATRLL